MTPTLLPNPLPDEGAQPERTTRRWCWYAAAVMGVLWWCVCGWMLIVSGIDDVGRMALVAVLGLGPALMTGWWLMWLVLLLAEDRWVRRG